MVLVTDMPVVGAAQFIFLRALQDKLATTEGPITVLLVLNEVTPASVAPYEEAVREAVREGGMPAFTFKKVKSGPTTSPQLALVSKRYIKTPKSACL